MWAWALSCIVLLAGCAPTPEQTRVAISDWRSGKADPDCEIDGESIQWQADYCMMAMQTDDIVAADRCMRIESRTYHGEECARRRYFKQEWCRGVVDNGSLPRTLAECIADPAASGNTVQGAARD
jgi:hypothetical protein